MCLYLRNEPPAMQCPSRGFPYPCQTALVYRPRDANPATGDNRRQYDCTDGGIGKDMISAASEPVFSFILHQVDPTLVDSVIARSAGINIYLNRPVAGLNHQDSRMAIMHSTFHGLIRRCALACLLWSAGLPACEPDMDGCLGCTDAELPVCVEKIAVEICTNGGGFEYCDKLSAQEDIERIVIRNTGIHMSRIRALVRGASRYQRPHPHLH
jgi:hypothetical protein